MSPDEKDVIVVELGYVKEAVKSQAEEIKETRQLVEQKLALLQTEIRSYGFVRSDIYQSEQVSLNKRVDAAHALAMTSIGLCVTIVIALLGYLVAVAG